MERQKGEFPGLEIMLMCLHEQNWITSHCGLDPCHINMNIIDNSPNFKLPDGLGDSTCIHHKLPCQEALLDAIELEYRLDVRTQHSYYTSLICWEYQHLTAVLTVFSSFWQYLLSALSQVVCQSSSIRASSRPLESYRHGLTRPVGSPIGNLKDVLGSFRGNRAGGKEEARLLIMDTRQLLGVWSALNFDQWPSVCKVGTIKLLHGNVSGVICREQEGFVRSFVVI
ncbi:hypothetical protein EDB19DRAFT_2025658 [Suillus lakei]|nr:hypothetical protein EDB19DRAFT_2025658 [Suillus lakei]